MKILWYVLILALLLPGVSALQLDILDTDPAPVTAGDYADVTIRVREPQNLGSQNIEYTNLEISVIDSKDYIIIGEESKTVGYLKSGDSATRTFRMYFEDYIPQGEIEIPFRVNSDQLDQINYLSVFINEQDTFPDLRIGQIETTPDELLPDTENNNIIVTLQNLGESEAELVTATLHIPDQGVYASTSYALQDAVSSIEEGEEAELEFTIDIEEEVRESVDAYLELRYRSRTSTNDNYKIFEKNISTYIELAASPYLEVINVEHDKLGTGSADNPIKITIANNGEKTADSVRMRLHPDISYPFTFEATTLYVATELDPGDQAVLEFDVEVFGSGITRVYPVAIELESLVGETLYSREDSIDLDVVEARSVSNRMLGISILIVVIIVALSFGLFNRKRKKK